MEPFRAYEIVLRIEILVKNMKLSIFNEIWRIFKNCMLTKLFYFLFSNLSGKLNLEFPFKEWNITLYVFNEHFKI